MNYRNVSFFSLAVILILSFLVRIYRVDQVLGFYFDQGRDALVIWDFWHNGKLFLIGPTTGIAGIFRGPFYYCLIAPFYLIDGGNPIYPAIFLSALSVIAIILLYFLAAEIQNQTTGIFAVILSSFSFYLVTASRWLSNPTPMLLLSMFLVYCMFRISEGKNVYWAPAAFVLGLSLFHFGSSGEIFYFPAVAIFALWQAWGRGDRGKIFPSKKIIIISLILFTVTAAPLIVFDFRHHGILSGNIKKFLVDKESFKVSFWDVAKTRLNFYYDVFTNKIFEGRYQREKIILSIVGVSFLLSFRKLWEKPKFKILILLFASPIVGFLFFQGNEGNIYDYYLTGYYLIFILLFAVVLGKIWKYKLGKVFVIYFFYIFLTTNLEVIKYRLSDGLTGPETIAFGNEKLAISWIYQDAKGKPFSEDVYVPPVIPYAYDYLFKWYGGYINGYEPSKEKINPLYTIYEQDPPHPERLKAWLDMQNSIGKVEKEVRFGGITVQRRTRIN
jgi:4-amino-4-deoxy-L-arabinose transferase-like glycosyltransferase